MTGCKNGHAAGWVAEGACDWFCKVFAGRMHDFLTPPLPAPKASSMVQPSLHATGCSFYHHIPALPKHSKFFAISKEFPDRHTAPLAESYRRKSRRLCDVWLRRSRAGLSVKSLVQALLIIAHG